MAMVKFNRKRGRGIFKPSNAKNALVLALMSFAFLFAFIICTLSSTIPSVEIIVPAESYHNVKAPERNPINPSEVNLNVKQDGVTNKEWYEKSQPLLSDWPELEKRLAVPPILEKLKLKRGIEVGVQKGILAKRTLNVWKSCEEYKLVDLWGREDGYQEPGGHTQALKDSWLIQSKSRLKKWIEKGVTEFFVMRSTDAAKKLKDNYFDYIYLDARHDYCAVMEDIEHYYPKLRQGGILGGHDYVDSQYAIVKLGENEDWSTCEDGSLHPEAVKGAVDKFAKGNGLYVITSMEDFPSWYIQKPYE